MTDKELFDLVEAKISEAKDEASVLNEKIKEDIKAYLLHRCKAMKDVLGTMPTQEEFLKQISIVLDGLIDFQKLIKGIAGTLLETYDQQIFFAVEKLISSRLGDDWYQWLIEEITKIESTLMAGKK